MEAPSPVDCTSTRDLEIRGPDEGLISSVEGWLKHAPPKLGERQWVDYRSAKELARAWFRDDAPAVPVELTRVLETDTRTRGFRALRATPELVTRLDDFRGEHRNHDLVAEGCVGDLRTVICVEAKADESFGDRSVGSYYLDRSRNRRSRVPDRIRELASAIFGTSALEVLQRDEIERYPGAHGLTVSSLVGRLRYQLLAAVGGTLIEANRRGADQAVFIVHEFLHEPDAMRGLTGTHRRSVERNRRALEDLIEALPGSAGRPPAGDFLVGPFHLPGGQFVPSDLALLIGKVTTHLV